MTSASRGLLLLAFLILLPRAQAQHPEPNSVDKAILKYLRENCLPQLEKESRSLLKIAVPTSEMNLKLTEQITGNSSPGDPLTAYMQAECANKEVCEAALVQLVLPPWNHPSFCTPTETGLEYLYWNGAALWQKLKEDNARVKLNVDSGTTYDLKKKSLRVQELLERIRKKDLHEVEENSDVVECNIDKGGHAFCVAVHLSSKESGDAEYNLSFEAQKKRGKWALVPNSLSFSSVQ